MQGKMGSVLSLNRRVSFQSLNDIVDAYQKAFRSDLDSVFDDLVATRETEKVRHLIAHRGGVVDRKFHEEMSDSPFYKDVPIGSQLPFDGPMVSRHVDACIKTGVALFSTVDSWSA